MKTYPLILAALLFCTFTVFGPPDLVFADSTILVPLDVNGTSDFTKDTSPLISSNGQIIAFDRITYRATNDSSTTTSNVMLFDRQSNEVKIVSQTAARQLTEGQSNVEAINGDGRFVLFESNATDLALTGNMPPSDGRFLFLRDTQLETTRLVPIPPVVGASPLSSGGSSISDDGTKIAFDVFYFSETLNTYSEHIYVWDIPANTFRTISTNGHDASLSADGNWIAYFDGARNVIQHLASGETTVINVCAPACDENTTFDEDTRYRIDAVTADGSLVAVSKSNSWGIGSGGQEIALPAGTFLFDRITRTASAIPPTASDVEAMGRQCFDVDEGTYNECLPARNVTLSSDGRYVAFAFGASLTGNAGKYSNVYRLDRQTGKRDLVSAGPRGDASNGASSESSEKATISADGSTIAFSSWATNLVADTASDAPIVSANRVFIHAFGETAPAIDTDNDGTIDTADGCHLDPLKTAPGSCGCGAADTDANGNNVADCLDPKVESLVFGAPGIAQETYSTTLNIFMQPVDGVKYQIKLTRAPKKKKNPPTVSYYYSNQPTFALAGLKKKTKGTISYRAYLDGTIVLQSPESPAASFKVKKPKKLKKPRK